MNDEIHVLNQVGIRLVKENTLLSEKSLNKPELLAEFISDIIKDYDREVMCVVSLDAKLHPLNMSICSIGALNSTITTPREIMKTVILSNANSFILYHNHPSGSCTPSLADIKTTDRMSKVGELMGVPKIDHIIVGAHSDEIYSFYEMGTLPTKELEYALDVADIKLRFRDGEQTAKEYQKQLHI